MKVLLPIQPEMDLGDYRAVRVPFETEPVTGEQVVQRLGEIQQQHVRWIPVDRAAAAGDQVVIDATGTTGTKEILKYEGEELVLDEQTSEPVPGFHAHLVGMTAGEEKLFPLLYPQDHKDEALAGKAATFSVHVHAVKQKDTPPLDDELAMMVGTYDTLDELKSAVGQQLEAEGAERAKPAYLEKVLEAIIAGAARIEYPPQAVDREAEQGIERLERNLGASGIKLDRYLQMVGKTRDAYLAEARPSAEKRLKIRLAMIEIAKKENLGVSMEEVEAEATRLSALLREEAADLRQALASPQGKLSLADDLLTARVQERIIEIGRGEAPPIEQAEEVASEESGPEDGTQPAPVAEESVPSETAALPAQDALEAQGSAPEAGDTA
jgi:trigger factor